MNELILTPEHLHQITGLDTNTVSSSVPTPKSDIPKVWIPELLGDTGDIKYSLAKSKQEIIKAADTIFFFFFDEAKVIVDARYSDPHNIFTRVANEPKYYNHKQPHGAFILLEKPDLKVDALAIDMVAYAKDYGPLDIWSIGYSRKATNIRISDVYCEESSNDIRHLGAFIRQEKWSKEKRRYPSLLIYNPTVAARQLETERKKRKIIERNRQKTGLHYPHNIKSRIASYSLQGIVGNMGDVFVRKTKAPTRLYVAHFIKYNWSGQVLVICQMYAEAFGHNSYRRSLFFQEFKDLWKQANESAMKDKKICQALKDFMTKEIKVRQPSEKSMDKFEIQKRSIFYNANQKDN